MPAKIVLVKHVLLPLLVRVYVTEFSWTTYFSTKQHTENSMRLDAHHDHISIP